MKYYFTILVVGNNIVDKQTTILKSNDITYRNGIYGF